MRYGGLRVKDTVQTEHCALCTEQCTSKSNYLNGRFEERVRPYCNTLRLGLLIVVQF